MITISIFYGDMYIVLQTAVIFPDAGLTLPSRPLNGVIFLKFIKFLCVCVCVCVCVFFFGCVRTEWDLKISLALHNTQITLVLFKVLSASLYH